MKSRQFKSLDFTKLTTSITTCIISLNTDGGSLEAKASYAVFAVDVRKFSLKDTPKSGISSLHRWNAVDATVEFVLTPQHETSCDSEMQTKEDFKKQVQKTTWKFGANAIEQHRQRRSIRISMLKVASPNGLNSRRVKLEQSNN